MLLSDRMLFSSLMLLMAGAAAVAGADQDMILEENHLYADYYAEPDIDPVFDDYEDLILGEDPHHLTLDAPQETIKMADVSEDFFEAEEGPDYDSYYDEQEEVLPTSDVSAIVSSAQKTSTRSKFLPNLTLQLLSSLDDATLLSYANDDDVIASLGQTKLPVLEQLLERLPANLSAQIASVPGILDQMSDEQILVFGKYPDALTQTAQSVISALTRSRPHIIPQLPAAAIDSFVRTPGFVEGLDSDTMAFLAASPEFADRLEELPQSTLALVVQLLSAETLAALPQEYPAKPLLERLVEDEHFLAMIPTQTHVELAESEFRHRLSASTVRKILHIYPLLPSFLSQRGMMYNQKYTRNSEFLDTLSCSVFLTLATKTRFVDSLQAEDLRVLARNEHVWSCLPLPTIRSMLKKATIGAKLDVQDIVAAAKAMSKSKSLDFDLAWSVLQYQVPDLAANGFKKLFTWQ